MCPPHSTVPTPPHPLPSTQFASLHLFKIRLATQTTFPTRRLTTFFTPNPPFPPFNFSRGEGSFFAATRGCTSVPASVKVDGVEVGGEGFGLLVGGEGFGLLVGGMVVSVGAPSLSTS